MFAKRYRVALVLAAALLTVSAASAYAFSFSDIEFWVGSGSNQAALVIDWNDGISPESLAWGYKWDGAATGNDMLSAVVNADPRLYANFDRSHGGVVAYGIGYDVDNDGFTYMPGPDDTGRAGDPADHYKEGWMFAGYWSYYLSADGAAWDFGMEGFAYRVLSDGCWDGWSWAPSPTWDGGTPSDPVAAPIPVPEPGSLGTLLIGMAALVLRRARRKAALAVNDEARGEAPRGSGCCGG